MEACWESWRPMRVRKVGTSGTNGVGGGMGLLATRVDVEEARRHWMQKEREDGDDARNGLRRIIVDMCFCGGCGCIVGDSVSLSPLHHQLLDSDAGEESDDSDERERT